MAAPDRQDAPDSQPVEFVLDEAFLDAITLHVDADIRVVDKPYGLAVQKGTRTGGDLDGLLMARAADGAERLRLVHRLDRETTGCLLCVPRTAA